MPSFMEMLMTREEQMQCSGIAAHDMPRIPHDVIPTRDLPRTRPGRDVCVCVCVCIMSGDTMETLQ